MVVNLFSQDVPAVLAAQQELQPAKQSQLRAQALGGASGLRHVPPTRLAEVRVLNRF